MKILILFALISVAQAGTFKVMNLCDKTPIFSDSFNNEQDVLTLSLDKLEISGLPYDGARNGLRSILNTPTGKDALELFGNNELRAYGWCYLVNGIGPEVFPHQYPLKGDEDVTWYFGFAHYKNGQWVSQCEATFRVKPAYICH